MQRTLGSYAAFSLESESRTPFSVVIAYEDFETGKHAREAYEYLTRNLGPDYGFSSQMWKFDVLDIPKMRQMAARDAAAADLIIISCRGASDLPPCVKEWNELWLAERGRPVGLVLLFDAPRDAYQAADISKYLSGIARRGGIEFFAQPSWTKQNHQIGVLEPSSARSGSTQASVSSLIGFENKQKLIPRWGINE